MVLDQPNPKLVEEDVFVFPASFAQQRLWFIEQLLPGDSLYVIPLVFRLTGALQQDYLQQSIQAIAQRHESLRTTFEVIDGQLMQIIRPELPVFLKPLDLRGLPANTREAVALEQVWQEIGQPFHLDRGVLFKAHLWQLQDTEHLLLLVLHHIVFDEWSSGVLIRELGELYTASIEDRPVVLPELSIQYADFAHWQRAWLQGDALNAQLRYWKQQLKDIPILSLPGAASRPLTPSHQGASQLIELPQCLLDDLEELSQEVGVTLFMTLLAAFQTLLHRYTGQTDLAIGSPIANRHRSELEGLIGFLVNSLVLRTDLAGDPSFRELLERVRDVTLTAYDHQDLPFEKLVEELQPVRSLSQNPLFQVVFALQNTPIEQLALPGLVLSPVELETKTARFDLELYLWKCGDNFRNLWGKGWQESDGLRGVIVYNTDLFDTSTITALTHHFQTLLEGVVAHPETSLSELPLLTSEEQRDFLQCWSSNRSQYPHDCCIHELFEVQVRQRPDAIAVQFNQQPFTYQQLNQGSNQLARYLQRLGITSGMPVGICLERGVEAIAAMLAVLKAGGAYVPLDPSYPAERLRFILEDAGITIVLTQIDGIDALPADRTKVICLEQEWDAIAQESDQNLLVDGTADQLAYVIYTSGSTGTPKGVMVPHRAVNRLVCNTNYVQIEPSDRMAQVANLAFDAATFEVWGALLNGAQLIGIERETTLSPNDFATELQQRQVSMLFLTTALFNQTVSQMPTAFQSLKYVLFGGEMVSVDRVQSVIQQGKPEHLIHVYGPTENTTFSTWYEIQNLPESTTTVPIGQAIANTQVYLLDAYLNPVPANVIGEIYVGGDGLAQGYLNRPELTVETFIQTEFAPLLYKTGDRALYRQDGNLEFLGRTDHQIKIRGFRVELGEIEAAIAQHPMVETAVVVVRELDQDSLAETLHERQLIGYIVPKVDTKLTERELRAFLKQALPTYMVPAVLIMLDMLPLTANGKVDQKVLPSPEFTTVTEISPIISPTTSLEAALVELWTQLLGQKQIGIHDNFFELGGHSLLATQLVSRIRDRFHVELPLRRLFETPTIAELAQTIESLKCSEPSSFCNAPEGTLKTELCQELSDRKAEKIAHLASLHSESIQPASPIQAISQSANQENIFPLSFAQQRLWFLYQLAPDNPFYNVPAAIHLSGTVNPKVLERSFREIVRRHAALRTTFTTMDGEPVQVVGANSNIELGIVDLQTVGANERDLIGKQLAAAEAQRPFNLTADSLLRVTLLQFKPTEAVLLLTMHHIVADGWSLGILIRELAYCYTAFVEGRSPVLSPLPIQYPDFACWQRRELQGEILERQLSYWRKQLQDLPSLELPSDRPRPSVQTYRGATYPLQISPTLTQALGSLSQQAGTSLFMTLLAAFQTLLYRYTGQEDIAVGSPVANRHRTELEGLIGFFVNSLVMRANLSGNPIFRELLEQVRDVALAAYEHQDVPFEKLVEELDPDRDLGYNPLFQVAFALQNAPMQSLELPGLKLEPAPLESSSTRFDLEVHLWEPNHGLRSLWHSQEGLSGFISYSTDLFERDRIGRLIGHFQTLLAGIVANPDTRLSDLPLLTPAERQQIVEWNQNDTENQIDLCFHQIFEFQVESTPEAIALVSEQGFLTYQALNQKADQLAQTLQQMGVQPDSLVGLCVERSADMVIGILGILKAGGAYVPLDPNYPSDRLHFIFDDTQVAILLTQSWLVEKLPRSQAQVICLDQKYSPTHNSSEPIRADSLKGRLTPDHLAYVIYTSGSTGTPKGVLLTHRGLCNVVKAQQQVLHTSRNSRILQFSSLSFDASIFEIALAFGSGGTLYIPPQPAQLPGVALLEFLRNQAITHALITPAVLAVLPDAELPDLQVLITGGEVCSSQIIDRWAPNRHFFNAYGPTETTIWATVAELYPGDHPLSIGRPILHTQIYILDANLNLVPVGISGEIYIGGVGLARGYLNRLDLTKERFIPNPLNSLSSSPLAPHSSLYKTGDRAQYRPDGSIEFLGRVDHQVKIRGFRVELGEVEATLQRHPAVQDAVVIASGEAFDEKRLVAYFSLDSQHLEQAILQSLQIQHIQHWQTLYNQTYESSALESTSESTSINQIFNTTGWNSSYTGEPIPREQMEEWVSDRVRQILALKPKRVLEIGCGTGLLLFQIAPHCQAYVGTDFSAVSLASIQTQLDPLNLPQVQLLHRMATDFTDIDAASFDVVILNSIVQYFPSADYLMQVLESAIQTVAPGGVLFVGDVRSLPLLNAFHAWVQFVQADSSVERTQLQQRVERSQFEEPELVIHPDFFYSLRDRFPKIQHIQVHLSRGHDHNEMTQFRYNVLIHLENALTDAHQPVLHAFDLTEQHNWQLSPITVEEIQKYLVEAEPDIFIITNIANSRLNAAVKTAKWLDQQEAPKTVGRMRDVLQTASELAINPQDWWNLETVLPYKVEITWSAQTDTGDYDVLLTRHGIEARINLSRDTRQISANTFSGYANNPLQSNFARQLIPELRQYLQQTLPDYMVPSGFLPLEKLPLNTSGKVNRRALATCSTDSICLLSTASSAHDSVETISLTPTEITLIDIWQELLRLKQVNRYDNFFELGGHSLLATQMTSRIRDTFGLELPLKSVFEAPTIAQLALVLEALHTTASTPTVPPLVCLERSTFRRQRSPLSINGSLIQTLSTSPPFTHQALASAQSPTASRSPLVPLTLGGNQPPFFCVHPMFGVVFPYLELANYLGSDRSFYGLQPLGLDGKAPPLNRIEAIAAYYIQAIQTLQPQGPYFIGGWSFGGLVAFEMAQQLTQAGQQIGLLAILDTPAPCNKPSLCQSLKFLLGTALWSTLPFLLDYGALATNRLPWLSRWQWSAIARQLPEESRLQLMDEATIRSLLPIVYANSQAAYRYVPQPYSGRITLFKAAEQPDATEQDQKLGWNALASEIELHQVPGNHLSLLRQPHVQILAQQLRQCLEPKVLTSR